MKSSRSQFKLALRKCRADKNRLASDSLAKKLMNNDSKDFWQEVKKVSCSNIKMQATTVAGATGAKNICDMWKKHYCDLLNSTTDTSWKVQVDNCLADMDDFNEQLLTL